MPQAYALKIVILGFSRFACIDRVHPCICCSRHTYIVYENVEAESGAARVYADTPLAVCLRVFGRKLDFRRYCLEISIVYVILAAQYFKSHCIGCLFPAEEYFETFRVRLCAYSYRDGDVCALSEIDKGKYQPVIGIIGLVISIFECASISGGE